MGCCTVVVVVVLSCVGDLRGMQYVQIPGTDLRVSRICYGTWNFADEATWGKKFKTQDAKAAVDAALECGINFFDCAEAYGNGRAEKLLGKALEGRRDRVVIGTKFGLHSGEQSKVYSGKDVEEALDASLARLRTTWVDLYQIHWGTNVGSFSEIVQTLLRLQKEGKIRYFGVCNFSVRLMQQFHESLAKESESLGSTHAVASLNQVPYSLLWRAIEFEIVPHSLEKNIGLLVYSPLQQGLLTGRYLTPESVPLGIARSRHFHKDRSPKCRHGEEGAEKETFEAINRLKAIADKAQVGLSQLALAWILSNPAVTSVIIGASTVEQIQANTQLVIVSKETLEECTRVTDELKLKLGPNPDMWAKTSRY